MKQIDPLELRQGRGERKQGLPNYVAPLAYYDIISWHERTGRIAWPVDGRDRVRIDLPVRAYVFALHGILMPSDYSDKSFESLRAFWEAATDVWDRFTAQVRADAAKHDILTVPIIEGSDYFTDCKVAWERWQHETVKRMRRDLERADRSTKEFREALGLRDDDYIDVESESA